MDSETRALARTAILLLVVSGARWAWTAARPVPALGEPAGLEALADSSRTREAEATERGRPLEPDERLDPNTADEVQLDRLPGVGPATAAEIVRERERGGAFASVDDLVRVRGLGPATVDRIRALLRVSGSPGRAGRRGPPEDVRIDVNRAGAEELARLPGIGPALAARIVEARRGGPFATIDDLTRVSGIGPATVARLRAHARAGRRP